MSKRTTKQGEMSTITNSGLTTTVWISHACYPGIGRMPLGLLKNVVSISWECIDSRRFREEIGSTARHTGHCNELSSGRSLQKSPKSTSGSLSIALSSDLPSFGRRIQQVSLVHALRIWTRMAVKAVRLPVGGATSQPELFKESFKVLGRNSCLLEPTWCLHVVPLSTQSGNGSNLANVDFLQSRLDHDPWRMGSQDG